MPVPRCPPYLSLIGVIVLIINLRSLPFMWHLRIFRHLIMWHLRKLVSQNRRKYMEETSPVAHDPFETIGVQTTWAGPDDCDFFGHLSNSAYAKNLDFARMEVFVGIFSVFMSEGGVMPLAGADYSFIKEIPMLSAYEMHSKIVSWDEKWIYFRSEFITRPGSQTANNSELGTNHTTKTIDRPGHKRKVVREDGTVVHCISMSKYCFKLGRLTVPPRIALCASGFGADRRNWTRSAALLEKGEMRRFLEGGWREQTGWDLLEFEHKRQAGMEWCRKFSDGMAANNL